MSSPFPEDDIMDVSSLHDPKPRPGDKRKRADEIESENDDGLFIPDTADLVPEDYAEARDDNGFEEVEAEHELDDLEDGLDFAPHNEAMESFPKHAIYDVSIDSIRARLAGIPPRILRALEQHDCKTKQLQTLSLKAGDLSSYPTTRIMRVAVLGTAGTGKSSLLNCITDIPDLAKSVGSVLETKSTDIN